MVEARVFPVQLELLPSVAVHEYGDVSRACPRPIAAVREFLPMFSEDLGLFACGRQTLASRSRSTGDGSRSGREARGHRVAVLAARCASPGALEWLRKARRPRVLNRSDHACNLIDERGRVLSLVSGRVGNGPFHLVLAPAGCSAEDSLLLSSLTKMDTGPGAVQVTPGELRVGGLAIVLPPSRLWNPRPNWPAVRRTQLCRSRQVQRLKRLLQANAPPRSLAWAVLARRPSQEAPGWDVHWLRRAETGVRHLSRGLTSGSKRFLRRAARELAGLGPGLTPAGDDLLVGFQLALWGLFPENQARDLAAVVCGCACRRTSAFSAAWLRAAASGEAAQPWHDLLAALCCGDLGETAGAARALLLRGHTSGSDALAGWLLACRAAG